MLKIRWTDEARFTFEDVIDSILFLHTQKEVDKFVIEAFDIINNVLPEYPKMFIESQELDGIRKAVLHKNTSMMYRVEKDHIVILFFKLNKKERKG